MSQKSHLFDTLQVSHLILTPRPTLAVFSVAFGPVMLQVELEEVMSLNIPSQSANFHPLYGWY